MRERRRNYTRDEIARVAIELFDVRGFDRVTVDEIADAAGMSQRTFFRYFPAKEDVLLHENDRVQRRLRRIFAEQLDSVEPVQALRNAYVESSTVSDENRERTLTYGRVQLQNAALNAKTIGFQAIASRDIVELLARGLDLDPITDTRPETIAQAMNAAATAMFRRWVVNGGTGTPSDAIAESLDLLIVGIATLDATATKSSKP